MIELFLLNDCNIIEELILFWIDIMHGGTVCSKIVPADFYIRPTIEAPGICHFRQERPCAVALGFFRDIVINMECLSTFKPHDKYHSPICFKKRFSWTCLNVKNFLLRVKEYSLTDLFLDDWAKDIFKLIAKFNYYYYKLITTHKNQWPECK